jgi:hypothetical protein
VRQRILVSAAIGLATGAYCWLVLTRAHQGAADFTWAIRLARHVLNGTPPYQSPLEQYPMIAALVGFPFVWMRPEIAGAVFYGVSSALLALGLTRFGYHRLLVFLANLRWVCRWRLPT